MQHAVTRTRLALNVSHRENEPALLVTAKDFEAGLDELRDELAPVLRRRKWAAEKQQQASDAKAARRQRLDEMLAGGGEGAAGWTVARLLRSIGLEEYTKHLVSDHDVRNLRRLWNTGTGNDERLANSPWN